MQFSSCERQILSFVSLRCFFVQYHQVNHREGEICTLKSVVSTLLISIVLIVLTIVKFKFHPFLALLLASFFVGTMMGMGPLDMVNAIESGIGGTLGFLAAVIGLGTILGK